MNYEELKNAIENLADSQIVGFYLDPDLFSLRLDFAFDPNEVTSVELLNIYHILLSNDPVGNDGRSFLTFEISFNRLNENRKDVLDSLGYMFEYNKERDKNFLGNEIYHLRIEGEICMHVICANVRILKQL